MKKSLHDFTGKYQLSKTLRFELIPQGKTLEHIQNKGLLTQDEQRANDYQKVKKIIDEYHKYFIEVALNGLELNKLSDYETAYFKKEKDDKEKKEYDDLKATLRKQIADAFTKSDLWKNLFAKELIKEDLLRFIDEKDLSEFYKAEKLTKETSEKLVKNFKDFTTYFTGFHENRKNMYKAEGNATEIAFRIVHENLPKFLDNVNVFDKVATTFGETKITEIETALEALIKGKKLSEIFTLEGFNNHLTQNGIDFYNTIIGGWTEENGTKKQGLNQHINLYNQKQTEKSNRLPKLKPLYKQILSDRESISFLQENFENSESVLNAIENYYKSNLISLTTNENEKGINVLSKIKELLEKLSGFDLSKIYLRNGKATTDISQALFNDWGVIKSALEFSFIQTLEIGKKGISKKQEEAKEKYLKKTHFSIAEIEKALFDYKAETDALKGLQYNTHPIADYFKTYFIAKKQDEKDKDFDFVSNIDARYSCIKGVLCTAYGKELKQDQKTTDNIKVFLDSIMELLHFVKPLNLPADSSFEKDETFYSEFIGYYQELEKLIPIYNKVRNYVTQKPYSTEKIKLNFENKGQFLGGWVDSHTESSDNATQAGGYLFRKKNAIDEYDYFLGISSDVKLFRSHLKEDINDADKSEFERLDYYQLKSASVYGNSYIGKQSYEKDRDNLFKAIIDYVDTNDKNAKVELDKYIKAQKGDNKPTPNGLVKILQEKYNQTFEKLLVDKNFVKENTNVTTNLKSTILSLNRVPKSQEYKDKEFALFTEPIQIIEELSKEKAFSYFSISKKEFDEALNRDEKPLLLFKVSNKDLSFAETSSQNIRKSRGKENLHTLYFKQLLSGSQNVFDIGTGEVFFRKKSLEYSEEVFRKGHHVAELKGKFEYPIISNKRFASDKFQFHLSVIMNYQQPKKPKDFESEVNKFLKNNPNVNIIGIDRGERHLLYLTLINQQGEILQQMTLNEIINTYQKEGKEVSVKTDYHTKLSQKEKEREEARESWGTIENIKELKEGYLSHVIHVITKMMVKNNAIVVMEDLNFGFKRGRFKVEKQVYQKFEKALIDKLNYLVIDKTDSNALLNAYQLANKFESFKKLGKQSGFIFYVPAWNTSKIDPTTGFVNLFNTKYESVEKAKTFFEKFRSISYNVNPQIKNDCKKATDNKGYFEFKFKYSNFTEKAEGSRDEWTVCTLGERIETIRDTANNNQWTNNTICLTEQFELLFGDTIYNITYGNGADLKKQINTQTEADFFKRLLYLFKLTLQMRNSITNSEIDYLISPVKNSKGEFYDSRKADATLPKDADANGAYHIAKKGLWVLEQINEYDGEDWKKLKLAISNKDWLNFVQTKTTHL